MSEAKETDKPNESESGEIRPAEFLVSYWRDRMRPLVLPPRGKPLASQLKETLGLLERYQSTQITHLGGTDFDVEQFETARTAEAQIWERFQPLAPNPGSYSPEKFQEFLANALPAILARYHILAKPVLAFRADPNAERIIAASYQTVFLEIDRVSNDSVVWDNETIPRQIAFIRQKLTFSGQPAKQPLASDGQTLFQTILIDDKAASEKVHGLRSIMIDTVLEFAQRHSQEEALRFFSTHPDRFSMAKTVALAQLNATLRSRPDLVRDQIHNTIQHETGHLRRFRDPTFRELIQLPEQQDYATLIPWFETLSVHDELNGYLAECRFSATPEIPMHTLIGFAIGNKQDDFSHTMTLEWTLNHLISEIEAQPAAYGIVLDESIALPLREQIIFQLPALIADREKYDALFRRLEDDHLAHLDESFGEAYFDYYAVQSGTDIAT